VPPIRLLLGPEDSRREEATDEASSGLPMPREPGYGSKRRQDAEAQRTCS